MMPTPNTASPLADSPMPGSRFVQLFATTAPDRAASYMADLYGPHTLRLTSNGPLDMELKGFAFGQLHVATIRYGISAVAQMSGDHADWMFSYLHRGALTLDRRRAEFRTGDAGVRAPHAVHDIHMSADMELMNLRVGEQEMAEACRGLMGVDIGKRLVFSDVALAGSATTAALKRVLLQLETTPAYPYVATARLERSLQEAALFELLVAWPNSLTTYLEQPTALPISTRRARDFIHEHLDDLPSVADVARHCGVGMRGLARGFERHLGVTPLRYMIELRLDKARQDLLAQGQQGNVTEVALRWGFFHQGMFAAHYRQRFNELPSETLRNTQV